jgi:hypothetical protein
VLFTDESFMSAEKACRIFVTRKLGQEDLPSNLRPKFRHFSVYQISESISGLGQGSMICEITE